METNDFEISWLQLYPDLDLVTEHHFHPIRKWRFDYAHCQSRVAIELEGGHWVQGRHTRGRGFEGDCYKYLEAALLGWQVIRLTHTMVKADPSSICEKVAAVIRARTAQRLTAK